MSNNRNGTNSVSASTCDRRSILFLLTNSFPYGKGEQFIETEIQFLSEAFSEVYVIPAKIDDSSPRLLAPNFCTIKDLSLSRPGRIKKTFEVAFRAFLSIEYWREISVQMKCSRPIIRIGRAALYLNDAIRCVNVLCILLKKKQIPLSRVVFYSYWLNSSALALAILSARHSIVVAVSRAHGHDLYLERHSPPYIPFRNFVTKNLHHVFPVCRHGLTYLVSRQPLLLGRITVARLGVDDPAYSTPPSQDRVLRLLSCSMLVPVKRVNLIIEAISQFAFKHPYQRIQWHHLGDGPLRSSLFRHAKAKFQKNVSFRFLGLLESRDVKRYFKDNAVDLFINCSESEGVPVSIMEAQSYGIPVVAPDVGGIGEIVDSSNGFLLRSDCDATALCAILEKVVVSPDKNTNLRVNSKRNWRERYYSDANYTSFANGLARLK